MDVLQENVSGGVRPLAGAGIEIVDVLQENVSGGFAPSRGRELKCGVGEVTISEILVRPLAGAGIEMNVSV